MKKLDRLGEKNKTKKELKLKELANTWKDKITEQVHQALYTYQIDITEKLQIK